MVIDILQEEWIPLASNSKPCKCMGKRPWFEHSTPDPIPPLIVSTMALAICRRMNTAAASHALASFRKGQGLGSRSRGFGMMSVCNQILGAVGWFGCYRSN